MSFKFQFYRKVHGAIRVQLDNYLNMQAGEIADWRMSDDCRNAWADIETTELIRMSINCVVILSFKSQEHAAEIANKLLEYHRSGKTLGS